MGYGDLRQRCIRDVQVVNKSVNSRINRYKTGETLPENKEEQMALLQDWRDYAYSEEMQTTKDGQKFWEKYFQLEKGIYEQLLAKPDEVVSGTVKELAEKYEVPLSMMVGFLDGINDSLKTPNPIEEMEEDTEVSLDMDLESLYKNMVDCGADWLYNLEQWNPIFTEEKRKELYKEQKASGTIRREDRKIGRNDPCPCGSGKKYKQCCGRK